MATYKVIQDIEAEDKFVGPLTLKQFIFAAITVVCGYISFLFITKHVWFLAVPLFPVIVAGGFLAFPWGRDQPTETWLLARISFFFKPRRRVWDQSGIQELVTITAPKKVEAQYTSNNLSQIEVRSRLKALANTIDSHGWAVKNVNVNLSTQPAYIQQNIGSDRLVATEDVPMDVPIVDIQASDDMLDAKNNPTAQKLDQMIAESAENRRKEMLEHMQQVREGVAEQTSNRQTDGGEQSAADYWFMDQPDPEKSSRRLYDLWHTPSKA